MPQNPDTSLSVDLTRIENAEVRRAVRSLMQQMQQVIDRQQTQIEALLEMVLDKHVGSIGEYKHYMQRSAQHADQRLAERVRVQVAPAARTAPPAPVEKREDVEVTDEGRHVYRL
jgi:hypothetical protein